MINNLTHFSIGLLLLFPAVASAQTTTIDLSLEQSMELLQKGNRSIRMAGKEVELAKNEHQKLNSFWFPSVGAAGTFVHMSNPVEVRQPLDQFTDPAKDFVHSILPDDSLSLPFWIKSAKIH